MVTIQSTAGNCLFELPRGSVGIGWCGRRGGYVQLKLMTQTVPWALPELARPVRRRTRHSYASRKAEADAGDGNGDGNDGNRGQPSGHLHHRPPRRMLGEQGYPYSS
ncbi:hypothetical protein [Actinoallomurus vinaceus]|uniref:hypothetical protein n=1 Tax=Actinoallomurus vinaceus TaxID=1080074 RepID=UPI0031EAA9E7